MVRRRTEKAQTGTKTKRRARQRRPGQRNSKVGNAARERSLKALWAMKQGDNATKAARDNGVSLRTIKHYVRSALVQDHPGGRIHARKNDRLLRYLVIPGPHGPMEIAVRGSKTATQFARYKAAVNRYLRGDRDAMADWHGKRIGGIELVTSGSALKNLAEKGLVPYSLYRSFTGGGR